jgi:murein DD-endopeptidase MepM/ murein hydrolase activator NlpD
MDALGPTGRANAPAAAKAGTTGADADARKVAAQFETLLLGELVKAMRASTAFSEEGSDAFAQGTYREMFDQSLVDAAVGGLGMGDALVRQLGGSSGGAATTIPGKPWVAAPATTTAIPEQDDRPWRPNPKKVRAAGEATPTIGTTFDAGAPTPGLWPVDGGHESSKYGFRMHPIHNERRFHAGLDIAAPEGREIRAVQSGTVTFAGRHKGFGNMVELRHPDGVVTRYAHASRLHVREGDVVDVGETIADVGSTGQSTGPHLHFEVRERGRTIDPHDYLERLREAGVAAEDGTRPRTGVVAHAADLARDVK